MSSNIKLAGKIPQTTVESMQRKAARDTLVALHGQLTDAAGTAKDGRLVLLSSGNHHEFTRRTNWLTQLFVGKDDRNLTNTVLENLLKKAGVDQKHVQDFTSYYKNRNGQNRSVKVSAVVNVLKKAIVDQPDNQPDALGQLDADNIIAEPALLSNTQNLPIRSSESVDDGLDSIEQPVQPFAQSLNAIKTLKSQLDHTKWASHHNLPKLTPNMLDELLNEAEKLVPQMEAVQRTMADENIARFNNQKIRKYMQTLETSLQFLKDFQVNAPANRAIVRDHAQAELVENAPARDIDLSHSDVSIDEISDSSDLQTLQLEISKVNRDMQNLNTISTSKPKVDLERKAHEEAEHIANQNIARGFQDSISQLLKQANAFTQMLRTHPLSDEPDVNELQNKVADPIYALKSQLNKTRDTLITLRDNGMITGLKSPIGNPENVELPSTVGMDSRIWSKLASVLNATDAALQNVTVTNESIMEAARLGHPPQSNYYPGLTKLNDEQLIDLKSTFAELTQAHTKTDPVVKQAREQIETHLKGLWGQELQLGADAPLSDKPPISPVQRYKDALQEIVIAAERQSGETNLVELTRNDAYTNPTDVNNLRIMMNETHLVIQQLENLNTQYGKPEVSRAADLASAQTWDRRAFGVRDTIHGQPQELISTKITETQTQLQQAYKLGMNLYSKQNEIGKYDQKRIQAADAILDAFGSLQRLKTDAIRLMKNMP